MVYKAHNESKRHADSCVFFVNIGYNIPQIVWIKKFSYNPFYLESTALSILLLL